MALKFFKQNFTYSFDKEFSDCTGLGRPSNAHNDDDYDYAIELKPDKEYRQVAANNSEFKDFADLVIDEVASKFIDDDSIATFDSKNKSENEENEDTDDDQFVEDAENGGMEEHIIKKRFLSHMFQLTQRQRWVETLTRRSSQAFISEYWGSESDIQSNFKSLLQGGVRVRKHEKGLYAEPIRLSTYEGGVKNKDKARSGDESIIYWEPEESRQLRDFLRTQHYKYASSTDIMNAADNDIGEFALDRCVKYCGCGDELYGGVRTSNEQLRSGPNGVTSESVERNNMFNKGFQRKGQFNIIDIIAVHPASCEDPMNPGKNATTSFRQSLDEFNPALSFSVILESSYKLTVKTVNIECDDERTYFTLLGGFILLRRAVAKVKRDAASSPTKQSFSSNSPSKSMHPSSSTVDRGGYRLSPQKMASTVKSILPTPSSHGIEGFSDGRSDPIGKMFYPDMDFDNMEMGGGGESHEMESFIRGAEKKDKGLQPPAQFLGWHTKGTQIWARLRMAGLEVKPVFSWDLKRVILKIRCPSWRLEEVAEKMHIRLKLRTGGHKRFKISQRELFQPNTFDGSIFRSSDRQRVIDFILRSKIRDGGAELDANTALGRSIVQRFPLHMHSRLEDLKNSWIYFWKSEKPGEIPEPWSPFSTPLSVTLTRLGNSCAFFYNGLLSQPLDQVAEYYGESVAFYFAWVAYFTRWMVAPSILGVIVFAVQISSAQLDHWICIPYGIFIVIWASLMLVFWRQKQSALAYRWGVLGFEMEETERPQFQGKSVIDPNTKEMRKVYPPRQRMIKYAIAVPAMLLLTSGMVMIMMIVLLSQAKLARDYENGEKLTYIPRPGLLWGTSGGFDSNSTSVNDNPTTITLKNSFDIDLWMALLYYPSMYGLFVAIASEFVDKAAYYLTNFENHRKESTYWNRLILKIFCFRFVAVFTPVYYYAFTISDPEEAYLKMTMAIFALMTVGDWWSKILSTSIPSWIHRFKLYRMTLAVAKTNRLIWAAKWALEFNSETKGEEDEGKIANHRALLERRERYHNESKSSCWNEALKKEYTATEDYTQMILQLGMVLLFGMVFPLIPLIATLNNLFFLRLDASKLMYTRKRPIAKKIGGLGVWEDVLQIMSVLGLLTNCCIMLFTSSQLIRTFAVIGIAGVAIMLFAYEHAVLLFKYFLQATVARVPSSVQRDQERNKILSKTRKLKKTLSDSEPNGAFSRSPRPNRISIAGHPQLSSVSSFLTDLDDVVPSHASFKSESKTNAANLSRRESNRSSFSEPPMNSVKQMYQRTKPRSSDSSTGLYMSSMSAELCSSSSSSSESECRSQVSNKKPLVPPALQLRSGPGPVRINSFSNMKTFGGSAQSLLGGKSAVVLQSASQQQLLRNTSTVEMDEEVHAMSDTDLLPQIHECKYENSDYEGEGDGDSEEESWWKIKCDSPIAQLGKSCTEHPAMHHRPQEINQKREKSSDTTLSSLTDFTTDSQLTRGAPFVLTHSHHDEESSNQTRKKQGRASLLQNPFGMAPPKLSRRTPAKDTSPQVLAISAPPALRKQSPNDDRTRESSLSARSHLTQYTPPKSLPEPKQGSLFLSRSFEWGTSSPLDQSPQESPRTSPINPRHDSSRVNKLADLVHPDSPLSKYVLSVFSSPPRGTPSAPLPKKPETPLSRQSKQSSVHDKSVKNSPPLPPSYENSPASVKKASAITTRGKETPSDVLSPHTSINKEDQIEFDENAFELNSSNLSQLCSQHTPRSLWQADEIKSNDSSPLTCDEVASSSLNVTGTPRAGFPVRRRPPSRKHTNIENELVDILPVVTLFSDPVDTQVTMSPGLSPINPNFSPDTALSSTNVGDGPLNTSSSAKRWGIFSSNKSKQSPREQYVPVAASTVAGTMNKTPTKPLPSRHTIRVDSNPFAALLAFTPPTDTSQPNESLVHSNDENHKVDPNSPMSLNKSKGFNKKGIRMASHSLVQSKGLTLEAGTKTAKGSIKPPGIRGGSPAKKMKSHAIVSHTQMSMAGETKPKSTKVNAREEKEKYENPFLKALGV